MRLDVLSERTPRRAGTAAACLAARSGNGRSFYCGTDGSNPVPSAGESNANLTSAGAPRIVRGANLESKLSDVLLPSVLPRWVIARGTESLRTLRWGDWIRTFSSREDGRRFRAFVLILSPRNCARFAQQTCSRQDPKVRIRVPPAKSQGELPRRVPRMDRK
jgi:hypothetical protein